MLFREHRCKNAGVASYAVVVIPVPSGFTVGFYFNICYDNDKYFIRNNQWKTRKDNEMAFPCL